MSADGAEVARWRSSFTEMARPEAIRQRARKPTWEAWARPMIALSLGLDNSLGRLWKGRSQGRRTKDALRTIFRYQPTLPGERFPRPGPSLRYRLRAAHSATVYPVRLTLYREGVPYGMDEGIVTFEDGRLLYDGDATTFVLCPEDATLLPDAFIDCPKPDLYDTQFSYGNLNSRRAWAFDLTADPSVRVYLYGFLIEGRGSASEPLYRWLVEPPAADGPTVLPPLEPRPGYVPPRGLSEQRRG